MLQLGTVLNNDYRVEQLLGKGGTAIVYRAKHTRLPTQVAIKVLTGPFREDPSFMQRFRREAEILAVLGHPHLVRVTDWNETPDGDPYLVMELLSGVDLAQFIEERDGHISLSTSLAIFRQAAAALTAAHEHGIVHRDLKPSNIFICRDGPLPNYVKVLDFGIAKLLQDASPASCSTAPSLLIGTPPYMSPEQAKGLTTIDARSDQFSLGVVLYELISGRSAFYRPQEPLMATLNRVIHDELPPLLHPGQSAPELSRIDAALRRALAKDPEQRWSSIEEFVEATKEPDSQQWVSPVTRSKLVAMPTLRQLSREALAEASVGKSETFDLANPKVGDQRRFRIGAMATLLASGALLGFFWVVPLRWKRPATTLPLLPSPASPLPSLAPEPASRSPVASLPAQDRQPASPSEAETPPPPVPREGSLKRTGLTTPKADQVEAGSATESAADGVSAGSGVIFAQVTARAATKEQKALMRLCVESAVLGLSKSELRPLLDKTLQLGGWKTLQILRDSDFPSHYRNAANACLKDHAKELDSLINSGASDAISVMLRRGRR